MAVIELRDIPDEAYEQLMKRAAESGQSVEEFVLRRALEEAEAKARKHAEVFAAVEAVLAQESWPEPTAEDIAADVAAERR